MKKNLIRALCVAGTIMVSTGVLAGCGQKNDSDKSSGSQSTKMETITVWSNNASQKAEDEKMVADFNNGPGKEKGITIDYKIYGGDYDNVLKVALSADEGPDMYKGSNFAFIKAGQAMPLEDLPGAKDWLKSYKDAGLLQNNVSVFNGKVYSVPYNSLTCAVAYNKDLLKKNGFNNPPKTWAELKQMAETVTKNGNGKEFGFIEGLKSTGYAGWNGLFQDIASVGHSEWDAVAGKYDYSSFAPFFQILVDMKKEGVWFPGVEGLNNDGARAQFAQGNIAFKLSASWDVGVWKDQFPAKMDWGWCRPVMDESNVNKYYIQNLPSFLIGKKASKHPEKVFEVFKLWHSDEAATAIYKNGKNIPLKDSIIKNTPAPDIKNWKEIADVSGGYNYPPTPAMDITVEGDTKEQAIIKILLGTVPVKDGLADLDKRYNAAVDKAKSGGLDISGYMVKSMDNKVK